MSGPEHVGRPSLVGGPVEPDSDPQAVLRSARRAQTWIRFLGLAGPVVLAVAAAARIISEDVGLLSPLLTAVAVGAGLIVGVGALPPLIVRLNARLGGFAAPLSPVFGVVVGAAGFRAAFHLVTMSEGWLATAFAVACAAVGVGAAMLAVPTLVAPPLVAADVEVDDGRGRLARNVAVAVAFVALAGVIRATIAADQASNRALDAIMSASNVASPWSSTGRSHRVHIDSLDTTICGADPDAPAHLGGAGANFGREVQPDGRVSGWVNQAVFVARSVEDAEREIEAIHAPAYLDCTTSAVIRDTRGPVGGVGEPAVVHKRDELPDVAGEVSGTVDRFELRWAESSGPSVVHVAFVRLQVDDLIIRFPVVTYAVAVAAAEMDGLIEAVVVAARAGG